MSIRPSQACGDKSKSLHTSPAAGTTSTQSAATRPDGVFPRLMQQLDQAVADGEVRLVSNLTGPLVLGGERRRVGLSSDLET